MKSCGFNSCLPGYPRGFGKVVLVSFGAKCGYESQQNIVDVNHRKGMEFSVFSTSPWTDGRGVNGITGIHWEQSRAGMEQGDGS